MNGTLGTRLLHDPALDEFTLLTSVTTVDDAISRLHQSFNDGKLLLDAFVVLQADAKAWGNHGKSRQTPRLPHGRVVFRHLQLTQVTERPRHLVAVAFHISVAAGCCPDDTGNILGHTGFLCNTNYHTRCKGTKKS